MAKLSQVSPARRIVGDVLLALVILLTVSVVFVMTARINAVVLKGDYQKVFRYELIFCAVFLLLALDVRFSLFTRWKPVLLKGIGWILRIAVILCSAVILFFCGRVIVGSFINTAAPTDYAIILGLALENGKPAPDLVSRVDTAKGWLEKNPEAHLILTGGNPDESGRTEAAVMRDLLLERGVPEDRLILEDQAKSTKENFRNIADLVSKDRPVVMVSSNYHMDRAVQTAKDEGFTQVLRLPAPSGFFAYGTNMLSEVVHNLNKLTSKRPASSHGK